MNRHIATLSALALGLAATAASAVPVAGLYNTGVDSAGTALAADALDTHYVFSVVSGTAVGSGPLNNRGVVQKDNTAELYGWTLNNAANWNSGGANSRWLVPAAYAFGTWPQYDQVSLGVYNWTTHFNLTGYTLSTAALSGKVGADNSVEVFLNGNSIAKSPVDENGFNSSSFQDKWATVINITGGSGMLAGDNVLTFRVTNTVAADNPTGLRTFLAVTAVPEPGTWALTASGLLLLALGANRRRAAQKL